MGINSQVAYRALLAAGGVRKGTWAKRVEVAGSYYLVGQKSSMPEYFVCLHEAPNMNLVKELNSFTAEQFVSHKECNNAGT